MTTRTSLAAALLMLTACQLDDACPDCDPVAISDLPCNGADLQNDDLNCGSCGHECNILWPDSDYAVGGCVEGECGPRWSGERTMVGPPYDSTCTEECALAGQECVPDGCAGMTGFVCVEVWNFDSECDLSIPDHFPAAEIHGSCDAEVPGLEGLEEFGFFLRYVSCCCTQP
jgi:hypothetical protein